MHPAQNIMHRLRPHLPRNFPAPPLPLQVLADNLVCDARGRILAEVSVPDGTLPLERASVAKWIVERVNGGPNVKVPVVIDTESSTRPHRVRQPRPIYDAATGMLLASGAEEVAMKMGRSATHVRELIRSGKPCNGVMMTYTPPVAAETEVRQ